MSKQDEKTLIALARRGSPDAGRALFRQHWRTAWRAAYALTGRRDVADDCAQEAFARAFAALDSFDGDRPFRPWLTRIAVNVAIDHLRRERAVSVGEIRDASEEEWFADAGIEPRVVAAVRALSTSKRTCIVLRYWLDYSIEDIAKELGIPAGTVMSRLSRALDELRTHLEAIHVD